jgi:excisionase family DNA binding protein
LKKLQQNNCDKVQEGDEKMEDVLYTVAETAKLLKTNSNYVYELIKRGLLPALKLGSYKVRKTALTNFLEKNEGKDLTDLDNIISLNMKGDDKYV